MSYVLVLENLKFLIPFCELRERERCSVLASGQPPDAQKVIRQFAFEMSQQNDNVQVSCNSKTRNLHSYESQARGHAREPRKPSRIPEIETL